MPASSRRRPRLAVGCALAAITAIMAGPVWAEPAPTYAALLSQLDQTPASREADALVDAAEARVRQALVRPNPVASLGAENVLGNGPFNGYANAETTLAVSQNLELWGRRRARVAAASAEAGTSAVERDLAVIDAAGRLALAYAEAEAAERRADLADEGLTLALADARAALALVEEGREPILRGIQAESEASAARAALDEAFAERDAAFARLTAIALLPLPVTTIEDSLLDQTPPPTLAAVNTVPTVRAAEAQLTAAERRIDVESINARPDVTASMGLRRFEAEGATALTFGLSLPLPLFDRNRGNIDAARAEYNAAGARLAQAKQDANADRAAAAARLGASTSRVAAADAGVTAAEEAYRLSRIGFDAGRISQLELRTSRTALINARNAAVNARLARVRAEIDRARLEGRAPFGGSL